MTTSVSPSIKKELAALPIARIETMDQSYVLSLREYLFTNGCQVFVNSGPTENVTYFFVVGDSNFVKKTLAFRHGLGKKQLILCWDTEEHESIEQFLSLHSKIVYIDPVPLTSAVLSEIFTFLFTAKGKHLDFQTPQLRKNRFRYNQEEYAEQIPMVKDDDLYGDKTEAPLSTDVHENIQKIRIMKAITAMFGKKPDTQQTSSRNQRSVKETDPSHPPGRKKVRISPFVSIALLILFFCITPFILYIVSFLLRGWFLVNAATEFKEGKGNAVAVQVKNEKFWSSYTHLTMPFVHTMLRFPAGENAIQAYERLDRLFDVIADAELELLTMNEAVLSMGSSLIVDQKDKQTLSPMVAVDTIKKNVPSIRSKLDLAAAYLQSFRGLQFFPFSLGVVQTQVEIAIEKVNKLRQVSEVGERISQLYPYIAGFREKQRVLVILQNSSELRPTGGFVGSLIHLTISEGLLEDMRIEDVYSLDGQLKGHVDPPTPVKELLAQEHWYLRDSNWNPDFPKSADTIRFFYEKETGEHINSVIGITSSLIVRILRVVGPVDVPFFNDRITADNFYLKSLYYTQTNFFPGSTQKKDFLGALMEALLSKIQKTPQSGIAIMEIIHDSLTSRDIQWFSVDPDGQQIIERFGWGGKVPAGSACLSMENQPSCVFSYFYINEANVGINKVNAFIERSQTRHVQISENGIVSETITRKIQNLSRGESGTGVYTSYLRLFFPSTSTLTLLTVDGKSLTMKDPKNKRPDFPYGEFDSSIPNLTGVGIALEVIPGREVNISSTVSYEKPVLSENKEALITFFDQKQAGVDQIPLTTTVEYPPLWDVLPFPTVPSSRMVAKPGLLKYNTVLSEDSEFSVRLIR